VGARRPAPNAASTASHGARGRSVAFGFVSRSGSANRKPSTTIGTPTAPTGSSAPSKYLSSSNSARKYHSGASSRPIVRDLERTLTEGRRDVGGAGS
jgi:hypothetical protein